MCRYHWSTCVCQLLTSTTGKVRKEFNVLALGLLGRPSIEKCFKVMKQFCFVLQCYAHGRHISLHISQSLGMQNSNCSNTLYNISHKLWVNLDFFFNLKYVCRFNIQYQAQDCTHLNLTIKGKIFT